MSSLEDLGLFRQVLTRRFATMIPLPAKVSKIQLDFSNRFSARAEVVVPEKIVYIELFDLPGGVHATNLSDVAPGKHEFYSTVTENRHSN